MSTKTDAVILALVAKWQALTVPAGTLAGVRVADGPQANEDPTVDWLFVGHDGSDPTRINEAARSKQDLLAFARQKEEDGMVRCAAVVVRGDDNVPLARADAYAIVGAAEDALRTDIYLGSLVMHAYVSEHTYYTTNNSAGAKVRVVFVVTYKAQV